MSFSLLFFADRLPPLVGGMEMHARYFIEHFTGHTRFSLAATVTKDGEGNDFLLTQEGKSPLKIEALPQHVQPAFLFFNSGRWIEEMPLLRQLFPESIFLYRTGGNEIVKAPLARKVIFDHGLRQQYWVKTINSCVDLLITNSAYTEKRLRELGISSNFRRYVGGVNAQALKPVESLPKKPLTLFCAARFVPYKNHALLLDVAEQLARRGHIFQLRLAGDGPLLEQAKQRVLERGLSSSAIFLGALDNERVCQEIARAHIYVQFSADHVTEVLGGSYIHSEGMGRSILEALTAGTFVIAGRAGALGEVIAPSQGLLLDLDKGSAFLADAVEAVIKNLPAKGPFSERYSWDNMFRRYEELLGEFDESIARHRKM